MLSSLLLLLFFLHFVSSQLVPPHMINPPNTLLTDPIKLLDYMRALSHVSSSNVPPLTIISDEQGWILQMDVPGLGKDDITITTSGPVMKIHGEFKCLEKEDPTCVERLVSEEVRFPEEADLESAQAELENGVLRVFVKLTPGSRSRHRTIPISPGVTSRSDQSEGAVKGFVHKIREKLGWTRRIFSWPMSVA